MELTTRISVIRVTRVWPAEYWGVFVLRGVLAILFGAVAIVWPELTVAALVLLFGAFAFVDGFLALVVAVGGRHRDWGWHVLAGLIGIGIGVVTVVWPALTGLGLLYLIAAWLMLVGALRLVIAVRMRDVVLYPWLTGIAGIVSLAVGVALIVAPATGAIAVVWAIGASALVIGILLVALGLGFRGAWDTRGP